MRNRRHLLGAAVTGLCFGGFSAASEPRASDTPAWPAMRFESAALATDGTAEDWLRLPFPSDERRHAGGTIAVEDMPIGSSLMRPWRELASTLPNFGLQSAVFLAFSGPLPTSALPETPAASLATTSALQLVDLTDGAR